MPRPLASFDRFMLLDVCYLDNHLLVVNKAPGMLTQADRTGDPDLVTLARSFLKKRYGKPGNVYVGLVHRLDRPASGIVVLARTSKSAARLSDQFRRRIPTKRYLTIVEGRLEKAGTLVDTLVKEAGHVRVATPQAPGGLRAELRYRAVETSGGRTLVDVELKTGRPHQIRVQMSNVGHPVVGDMRYGARSEFDGRNLALHAYDLGLEHPTLRKWMRWQAPTPATWDGSFTEAVRRVLAAASAASQPAEGA